MNRQKKTMKIEVVGAGISGLVSAYVLTKAGAEVVLFEKEEYLGSHSKMVNLNGIDLDLGFTVFDPVIYLFFLMNYTFCLITIRFLVLCFSTFIYVCFLLNFMKFLYAWPPYKHIYVFYTYLSQPMKSNFLLTSYSTTTFYKLSH